VSEPLRETTLHNLPERLEAARRWWMPRWLTDLLRDAASEIRVLDEARRDLRFKLDLARGDAHD
jgi:hypothetical protein